MSATILQFVPNPKIDARSRIKARRGRLGLAAPTASRDSLIMDHADSGIPCDVAYCAPERDPA